MVRELRQVAVERLAGSSPAFSTKSYLTCVEKIRIRKSAIRDMQIKLFHIYQFFIDFQPQSLVKVTEYFIWLNDRAVR